jgi:hypothetical protein
VALLQVPDHPSKVKRSEWGSNALHRMNVKVHEVIQQHARWVSSLTGYVQVELGMLTKFLKKLLSLSSRLIVLKPKHIELNVCGLQGNNNSCCFLSSRSSELFLPIIFLLF